MLYEIFLVVAVVFFAGSLFLFASGGQLAVTAWARAIQGIFILALLGMYFLWCWLRGGQTLPMKAWRIRLVQVTPVKAVLRYVLALLLVPTGISIGWALFDRDRQFLHDRIAGTRLVDA